MGLHLCGWSLGPSCLGSYIPTDILLILLLVPIFITLTMLPRSSIGTLVARMGTPQLIAHIISVLFVRLVDYLIPLSLIIRSYSIYVLCWCTHHMLCQHLNFWHQRHFSSRVSSLSPLLMAFWSKHCLLPQHLRCVMLFVFVMRSSITLASSYEWYISEPYATLLNCWPHLRICRSSLEKASYGGLWFIH